MFSPAVMRNIRPNLIVALIYNVAGVPIAARVLYPTGHRAEAYSRVPVCCTDGRRVQRALNGSQRS